MDVHVTLCLFQETLPLYKRLEKRLELMNEYVQVTAEMNQAATSLNLSGSLWRERYVGGATLFP